MQHINMRILVGLGVSGLFIAALALGHRQSRHPPGATVSVPAPPSLSLTTATLADRAIHAAEAQIARDSQKVEGYIALATAYVRKARESGDTSYYLRAEVAVQRALALQPDSYEGLRVRAWIQTGKHEFREAFATATRLQSQRPEDPWVYSLLGDTSVELGDYQRAVDAFEQMMERRPGLPAYSRVAHIRELFGDPQGAAEAMAMAVRTGSNRDPEPLAWCLVQYGKIYFNQGNLQVADAAAQKALAVFPNYPLALAFLGQVRGAQQRYAEAIALYQQAVALVPSPDVVAALGDLLALTGKTAEAEQQYALVEYIEQVNETNEIAYNRQLARFYADHDRKLDDAVRLAEVELQRRQDIYSFDTLAWVYYKQGRFAEARKAMEQALRLGTRDASLLFHAGMIAHRLGDLDKARDCLRSALATNPYFSLFHAESARKTLAELEQQAAVQGESRVPSSRPELYLARG